MHFRNLVLYAASAVLFCAALLQLLGKPTGADNATRDEPGLIADRLRDLHRLQRVPLAQQGTVDPSVRPASANVTMLLPLAASVAGQQGSGFQVTSVTQGNYIWNNESLSSVLLLLSDSDPVEVAGVGAENDTTVKITNGGDGQWQGTPETNGNWEISIPAADLGVVRQALTASLLNSNSETIQSTTIRLRIPSASLPKRRSQLKPKITATQNNKYGVPVPVNAQSPPNVYDRFLEISGEAAERGFPLQFLVFQGSPGSPAVFVAPSETNGEPSVEPNSVWKAELFLPRDLVVGSYQLIVLATNGLSHQVGVSPLTFAVKDPALLEEAPALAITDTTLKDANDVPLQKSLTFGVGGNSPKSTQDNAADSRIVVYADNTPIGSSAAAPGASGWTAEVTVTRDDAYTLTAAIVLGNTPGNLSNPVPVRVGTQGPIVVGLEPTNLAFSPDRKTIAVKFDPNVPVDGAEVVKKASTEAGDGAPHFSLKGKQQSAPQALDTIEFDPAENSATLRFTTEIPSDIYTFTVNKSVKDVFGNSMKNAYATQLIMPVGAGLPTVSRGITGPTGPNVEFGEYTEPRDIIDGFNPSDRVETRVSRLYYYRDAHRVAQIVNREAKSYNRAAVDMQQQLADKSRQIADQATDDRQAKERNAIRAAQKTREAENELEQAEAMAASAARQAANAATQLQQVEAQGSDSDEPSAQQQNQEQRLREVLGQLEDVAEAARARARAAREKVQRLREQEAQASEQSQVAIAVEDRAREEQFRREVAAAHADPDTYAPGNPESQDPVRQVSVSVIGEGLIQLRGPIKGINVIRTMINQIDAPVGQVRVSVHTVQINGEKGDRMEQVAGKIQRYIDHSRFLTLQSAEMLRKSIVQVAAQKAMEMGGAPGMTQAERDQKYLYSFFGEDFIRELEVMDSEFLMTGNKLLSIHSMDSTSLASALFIMALAKNSTRMEILQVFEGMMAADLPAAEQSYYAAGLGCGGKHKLFQKHCQCQDFCFLSNNARFQSIRGFFDAEIGDDDTMTPLQREFVRLAQIFKSRLIVEMELKQRVMERAVIEERLGDRKAELEAAKAKEDAVKKLVEKSLEDQSRNVAEVNQSLQTLVAEINASFGRAESAMEKLADFNQFADKIEQGSLSGYVTIEGIQIPYQVSNDVVNVGDGRQNGKTIPAARCREVWTRTYEGAVYVMEQIFNEVIRNYKYEEHRSDFFAANDILAAAEMGDDRKKAIGIRIHNGESTKQAPGDAFTRSYLRDAAELKQRIDRLIQGINEAKNRMQGSVDTILVQMSKSQQTGDYENAFQCWTRFRHNLLNVLWTRSGNSENVAIINKANEAFQELLRSYAEVQQARQQAKEARQPLDHKKFLDMLVDEMEDKYIELLEGTRAHTANIDAYLKRIITSLDDDFNTQFYNPTFRQVREASQLWDVQMGQVETTNVLANNRSLGKVSPQATMEFDLPKRDIVIVEAMNGAKAAIDDFGALTQDPTFLALARLGSGQPTSSPIAGAAGGLSVERNVLPAGLSTATAESVLSQQGPGGSQFGAALESLIPDPAVYKFETGTGWEIRPVIQPDGQAVVFDFNYMYTTSIREPVRADEKHLGRVKRHFVDTDVQLSNFELREVSRFTVALKASRTSRGVPLLEDVPVMGALFRPLPSDESSLQQNVIMGQATIFPTLFDLMGLRWAPVVADLDPLRLSNDEFIVRSRRRAIINRVFDKSSSEVDKFLRIPEAERRMDLYRSQETIPAIHPNGYRGPGANLLDSHLQEGYSPTQQPPSQFIPGSSVEGSDYLPRRRHQFFEDRPVYPSDGPGESPQDPAGDYGPQLDVPTKPTSSYFEESTRRNSQSEKFKSRLLQTGGIEGLQLPPRASGSGDSSVPREIKFRTSSVAQPIPPRQPSAAQYPVQQASFVEELRPPRRLPPDKGPTHHPGVVHRLPITGQR